AAEYPREKTIHQLFEEQVERTPDKAAVIYEGSQLTYRELNERANQLARTLRVRGVQVDDRVAIMAERSLEMIVGIFGILKAGGAYVPIDPEYPAERIRYMLEDSGATLLLSQIRLLKEVPLEISCIDLNDNQAYDSDDSNLGVTVQPQSLAYLIYTSGTTGLPKGAMITQQGLVNYIWWAKKVYVAEDHLDFPLYSSISFDLTVTSVFTPLMTGSSIRIYEGTDKVSLIRRIVEENQVDILKLTPTHLSLIQEMNLSSKSKIRKLIVGGENLSTSLANKITEMFNGRIEIFNEYGPTETVVGCMIYRYDVAATDTRESVPIGVPADNVKIYLLNSHHQFLPKGVLGEIYIAGDGVALGYLNKPELTAEKFVANPFEPGERMYRTGDLARWLPDGNIEYLGRIDHQVKIRGYRIELGEIEAQLLKVESVREAVVVARETEEGQKDLCAYVVSDHELAASEIRAVLSQSLPGYMIPAYFVQIDRLPLTPNGKIDRKALPAPAEHLHTGAEYIAARTPVEEALVSIWQAVLGVSPIGVQDNFFDLGGHSLRATTLVAMIHKELGADIPLRTVFQKPTIAQMARMIEGRDSFSSFTYARIPAVKPSSCYPVSSAQKRLYILSQMDGGELSYNMPAVITVEGELDRERLEETFRKLIRRHESLRTGFELVEGNLVQRVYEDVPFAVEYTKASEEQSDGQSDDLIRQFVRPFALQQAPL
ncbi:non-ribosomal peptide synthetase, partial [Paenibacillus fonticola]|uniref:non-ribosomal peptide synthetase n=1 Tax=Paenibacillus fonticola TaxID=379896 RepID=UPI000527C812